mmetsp:Transcript_12363/g.34894  ORF Transcript_12363/g.34894 Transcript_12363/m.34894 type:complete len:199 (+) Transcript_12363:59-655(+)|eukprot:CAMPEP_0119121352 /NCGR_PEP_ID=MMETSP1310-20130426/2029_1 /TAXON_ID=464262 /ORGANISM="Genus nov. species nov., Strain RCC2339" /LENGTH=198 /DNA_ID=CAMNT_0007110915 /DNA_START=56 /DNA_END=652 /DNA_ORIENTATION=-
MVENSERSEDGRYSVEVGYQEKVRDGLNAYLASAETTLAGDDGALLRKVVEDVAKTGLLCYEWSAFRKVLLAILRQDLDEFLQRSEADESGGNENVAGPMNEAWTRIKSALEVIAKPPFTLQRLCEIALAPNAYYTNVKKFMYAVEKVATVTYNCILTLPEDYEGRVEELHTQFQPFLPSQQTADNTETDGPTAMDTS